MKSKENLKKILENVESIAIVGASPNIKRDSNIVMKTLINLGADIHAKDSLDRTTCYYLKRNDTLSDKFIKCYC